MKKIMKTAYLFALIVGAFMFTGCEDWFDVSSDIDAKEDDLYKTENGYFDALIGVYAKMAGTSLYGDQMTISTMDLLAYSYVLRDGAPEIYTSFANFDYKTANTEKVIASIWEGMYNAIANDNKLLERLENADRKIFDDDNYDLIKGEALALRAYLHFDLLRMFGPSKVLDKGEKCMPYVTTFGQGNTAYSTFDQVIEKVLADIDAAIPLFDKDPIWTPMETPSNVYLVNRKVRMNAFSVRALRARVMLYAGKTDSEVYDFVSELMDTLQTNINYPRLTTSPQDIDKDKIISGELLFGLYVDKLSNVASGYFPSVTTSKELGSTKEKLDVIFEADKYKMSDVRYELLFVTEEGLPRMRKFRQEQTDNQRSRNQMPMLRLSEIYYIAAETAPDVETALVYINAIRTARSLLGVELNTKEEVISYLDAEYRREMLAEGQIFYRYKYRNLENIPDCEIKIADKLSEVYRFPLPQQEQEWGQK